MKLRLVVFVAVLVSLSAIRAKPSKTSKLQAEGEKFVAEKLSEFKEAAKKPHLTMEDRVHFLSLLEYVKKADAEISKLDLKLMDNLSDMAIINDEKLSRVLSQQLYDLTTAIDENQDKRSYYSLGYAIQWIDKRLPAVNEKQMLKDMMTEVRNHLVAARDHFERVYIQGFVPGVKQIKMLTSMGRGPENAQLIKNIIQQLYSEYDADYDSETSLAVSMIEKMTDSRLYGGQL